jgi:hypothetical protein
LEACRWPDENPHHDDVWGLARRSRAHQKRGFASYGGTPLAANSRRSQPTGSTSARPAAYEAGGRMGAGDETIDTED